MSERAIRPHNLPASSAAGQTSPWTTLTTTIRYEDPWIQLLENQVVDPMGRQTFYRTVHYKQRAIAILPIDQDGHTTLVGQFRYPLGRYSWELPGGGGSWDEPAEASARRELREETGLIARGIAPVLRLDLSNGIGDEQAACFLAWGLEQGAMQPDENEVLALRRLPFSAAVSMAENGGVTEAVSVALILRAHQMVQAGEAPRVVLDALQSNAPRSGKRSAPAMPRTPRAKRPPTARRRR